MSTAPCSDKTLDFLNEMTASVGLCDIMHCAQDGKFICHIDILGHIDMPIIVYKYNILQGHKLAIALHLRQMLIGSRESSRLVSILCHMC